MIVRDIRRSNHTDICITYTQCFVYVFNKTRTKTWTKRSTVYPMKMSVGEKRKNDYIWADGGPDLRRENMTRKIMCYNLM